MVRVRIKSDQKYGWLGKEMEKNKFHVLTDDKVNYFMWPISDIEYIGEFNSESE